MWREHREHQDCECGGSRAALARALRALAGRLEVERFVSFSSVFFGAFWLDPGEGCENMQRAFAGCLELERFVSFSCLFPELSGSIPGKAEKTCETQHQPVALLGR